MTREKIVDMFYTSWLNSRSGSTESSYMLHKMDLLIAELPLNSEQKEKLEEISSEIAFVYQTNGYKKGFDTACEILKNLLQ